MLERNMHIISIIENLENILATTKKYVQEGKDEELSDCGARIAFAANNLNKEIHKEIINLLITG